MREHREIVQIATIEIQALDNFIELQHFSVLIKPKTNSNLSGYFTDLTGISIEMIEKGTSLEVASEKYKQFIDGKNVYACGN